VCEITFGETNPFAFQVIKKEKVLLHDIFNFIFVEPREMIRAGAGQIYNELNTEGGGSN